MMYKPDIKYINLQLINIFTDIYSSDSLRVAISIDQIERGYLDSGKVSLIILLLNSNDKLMLSSKL